MHRALTLATIAMVVTADASCPIFKCGSLNQPKMVRERTVCMKPDPEDPSVMIAENSCGKLFPFLFWPFRIWPNLFSWWRGVSKPIFKGNRLLWQRIILLWKRISSVPRIMAWSEVQWHYQLRWRFILQWFQGSLSSRRRENRRPLLDRERIPIFSNV